MLKGQAAILCDDRNIVRRWKNGWRVHGTWSHGDVAEVSPASAPLRAIMFLRVINNICDLALLVGFSLKISEIDIDTIRKVIKDSL